MQDTSQAQVPADPTGDTSGVDVDALMGQIEQGGHSDIPMQRAPEPASAPQAAPTPEVEFTWNGKQIKAPLDKASKWAAQGYDYAQKMEAFKNERSQWEQQQQQFKDQFGHYQTIDQFARENPQWWQHVQSQWEQRAQMAGQQAPQGVDPSNPLVQELQSLKSEFSQIKEFKESIEHEKLNQQRQEEDRRINDEIDSIRKTYPDLDLAVVDDSGKTLEMRVIEHAIANGIKSFKTAFHDFNHERLQQLAMEKGKQLAMKERQKQTKLGLLGSSPTPVKGFSEPKNIKNQSYEDLYREALDEMRG